MERVCCEVICGAPNDLERLWKDYTRLDNTDVTRILKMWVCLFADEKGILDKIKVQSTLVISKSKRPSKTLRDIHTLTYQICSIEEKTI